MLLFTDGGLEDFAALTLLALVQGLTEFLPVSSSGHLVLTQHALGLAEPALAIDIALHVGTLLAVLLVYRRAVGELVRETLSLRWRALVPLVLGTLPAAVIGVLFKARLEHVYHRPDLAAAGLLTTTCVLLVGERARRRRGLATDAPAADALEEARPITPRIALLIGVAQAVAIFPGISRSGSTIACGLLLGLAPRDAARFSFLLSIPAILGAAVLSLPDALAQGGLSDNRGAMLWAALFAGFVGWGALRALLAFLARGAFAWFALYCALLGGGYLLFA